MDARSLSGCIGMISARRRPVPVTEIHDAGNIMKRMMGSKWTCCAGTLSELLSESVRDNLHVSRYSS